MKRSHWWSAVVVVGTLVLASSLLAGSGPASPKKEADARAVVQASESSSPRIEGEKRFHANCGRCHAAPQKFPPRMMGTVLRHMRVRAAITDEDRRLILLYMTQ
ncbi:MAG TPA: cytochrome c [Candidatus Binatia bacterium]|nr:cytochrome c [Candidatus Binatia bacterium]